MENDFTQACSTEIPDVETLRELLARLNEGERWKPITRSEHVTVEDVAEALHLDPDYVARELEAIHQEHKEARLAGVIRELEEPLYRVERTGHSTPDPLGNPLFKMRSVQILAERNKVRPVLPRREEAMNPSDRLGQIIGHGVLYLMVGLLVIFFAKVAIAAVLAR